MRGVLLSAIAVLLTAATVDAQTASSAQPRTLSTMPTPPDGATPVPAQMSGLPLEVGDLPPGIVAVRVIRSSFENNVPNQTVHLRVGSTNRVLAVATSSDGRAQFDGLAVGDVVRVRTELDGELLESQAFPIPSQGGVRLVLVAGAGAEVTAAEPWPEIGATTAATVAGASALAPSQGGQMPGATSTTSTATYVAFGAVVSVLTAGVVFWPRTMRWTSSAAAPSVLTKVPAGPEAQRSEVFEQLVQLEKDYEAGRLAARPYAVRREALIEALLSFDSP